MPSPPLLPFPPGCRTGALIRRYKRFLVDVLLEDGCCTAHTNNSGSMLGLTRPGAAVLLSPATNAGRKLPWTLELVRCGSGERPALSGERAHSRPDGGFWVGVNTLAPNRLLRAAFQAGRLAFARGYTSFHSEAARGGSRLDALLTGPGLPPLWVECKNVTLVEDEAAAFPDAVTTRGQKHLEEMTAIVASGERAAFFYCVQRPDARCFAPADFIDPDYARLFAAARAAGVESYPYLAPATERGIDLGALLPLASGEALLFSKEKL